jgi:hypothetical protein
MPRSFRKCVKCGLYSYHDADYKPRLKAWANWCYTDMIAGEVAHERAKYEEV